MTKLADKVEETLMAFLLFSMTVLTFANVVARYVFNSNILWALEATTYLFAWLVLLGVCYGVKKNLHIGVDVLVNLLPAKFHRPMVLFSCGVCILFTCLLLIGAWNYWYPFVSKRAWLEVNDIPMPDILRFIEPIFNEGESYERMPQFIPYAVLPISMALLLWRFLHATYEIARGRRNGIIASHTIEEIR